MHHRVFCAVAVAVLGLLPGSARAFCDMNFRSVPEVRFRSNNRYDVFATAEAAQTIFFRVQHHKSDGCSYFVTFSKGQTGSYDRAMNGPRPEDLRYQFYDTPSKSNVLKEIPEATSAEVLSGTFGTGNESQELSYYVAIPAGQMVAAGDYQDNITVRLYEGTLSSYTQRDQTSFNVEALVQNALQMCVVGCGAPFDPFAKSRTLAFGTLHSGDNRALDLLVRSNLNYEVLFRSDNRGTMARTSGSGSVPYTATLNGAAINLSASSAVTVIPSGTPTTMDGDRYTLSVTIGNLTGANPGSYQDNIAITVRSR